MGRLENKVAVVTGGARGIGKATCKLMAEEGARVAVTDIIQDEGEEAAKEIKNAGGTADFWRLDTTQEAEVQEVIGDIAEKFGGIHILVNNAGISGTNEATEHISVEDW